jgi:hypothetical protein
MKVLDLQCSQEHQFEGWFGSEEDFQTQLTRGMLECPMCGEHNVVKRLSAPRLNLLASRSSRTEGLSKAQVPLLQKSSESESQSDASKEATPAQNTSAATSNAALSKEQLPANVQAQMQAAWLNMVQHVMANTEDVGSDFAEEARKIHYGEAQERNIRGQVSQDESLALLDEGIPVMPLIVPNALKGSVH